MLLFLSYGWLASSPILVWCHAPFATRKGSGQIRYKKLFRRAQNPACQSDCSASHLKRDVSKTLSCSIEKPTTEIVTAAKLAPAGLGCSQLKHEQLRVAFASGMCSGISLPLGTEISQELPGVFEE